MRMTASSWLVRHRMTTTAAIVIALPFVAMAPLRVASAQSAPTAPVLSEPMVARYIRFIEWALEITLHAADRATVRGAVIDEWNRGNRDGIVKVLTVEAQLPGLPNPQRLALRRQVQADMVRSLRADRGDPRAQRLVALYDDAHRPVAAASTTTPQPPTSPGVDGKPRSTATFRCWAEGLYNVCERSGFPCHDGRVEMLGFGNSELDAVVMATNLCNSAITQQIILSNITQQASLRQTCKKSRCQ